MENAETRKIVSAMLAEGAGLSEIQTRLASEHQIKLTFLDLKLIVSEIEGAASSLDKNSKQQDKSDDAINGKKQQVEHLDDEDAGAVNAEIMDEGATVVEMDKLLKPGTAISGNVKFASGAKADWAIDHYGRFTLHNAVGKPTQDDLALFQEELRKKLGG